ncbi:hypothetical protein [Streptosporangium sp. NPDC006007]|uniref:hypothetical protein n=1 Tax=Streptosporangium sp. NPDC006007 TaxID=3154575 RepID=UPI0033B075B2
MAETPCPSWCTTDGEHHWHRALVAALDSDTMVSITTATAGGDAQVRFSVWHGDELAAPATYLTPPAARSLGRALVARGRDVELGEALIAAADLIGGE